MSMTCDMDIFWDIMLGIPTKQRERELELVICQNVTRSFHKYIMMPLG